MAAYVIVPGIGGSGDGHWQTLWQQDWGRDALRITPGSWDRPDLHDWIRAIQQAVSGISPRSSAVIMVAHSLGCWAVAEWVRHVQQTTGQPIRVSALLVAPPDPRGPLFPAEAAPTFRELTPRPVPCRALVVASGNDPYCDTGTSRSLARGWNAQWHLAGDYGHINSASGVGDWTEGRELLAAFLGV